MLEIALDSRDSEDNRAVAVTTIDNLASALTFAQAHEAASAIAPLALGNYAASIFDNNLDDPLSPTQIRLHTPHLLRAAAIGAVAELVAAHRELERDDVTEAVASGLRDGPEIVFAAALGALAKLPDMPAPHPVEHALLAPEREIRDAALVAWLLREGTLPDDRYLEALLRDPDEGVRWRVLVAASQDPRGPALLARIEREDEDIYFRLVAGRRAKELGEPD